MLQYWPYMFLSRKAQIELRFADRLSLRTNVNRSAGFHWNSGIFSRKSEHSVSCLLADIRNLPREDFTTVISGTAWLTYHGEISRLWTCNLKLVWCCSYHCNRYLVPQPHPTLRTRYTSRLHEREFNSTAFKFAARCPVSVTASYRQTYPFAICVHNASTNTSIDLW